MTNLRNIEFGYQIASKSAVHAKKQNSDLVLPTAVGEYYEFYRVRNLVIKIPGTANLVTVDSFAATTILSKAHCLVIASDDKFNYLVSAMISNTESLIYSYYSQATLPKLINLEELAPNHYKHIKNAIEVYLRATVEKIDIEFCKIEKKSLALVGALSTTDSKACFVNNVSREKEINLLAAQFEQTLQKMRQNGRNGSLTFFTGQLLIEQGNLSIDAVTSIQIDIPSNSSLQEISNYIGQSVTKSRIRNSAVHPIAEMRLLNIEARREAEMLYTKMGIALNECRAPQIDTENPTETLQDFIKKHSKYYKTDGQLLANRKNYFDPQGKFLIYECQLSLGAKENHIGELGKGDTAGRAQRDAVYKLLKKLQKCAEILSAGAKADSEEKISALEDKLVIDITVEQEAVILYAKMGIALNECKAPQIDTENPTETLQDFIKKHSKYYKTDGQLLANRKNYFDPQGKFLIYECQLSLGAKENHIGELGKGDTAGRAQRDAVYKLLKKLQKCAEILSAGAKADSEEKTPALEDKLVIDITVEQEAVILYAKMGIALNECKAPQIDTENPTETLQDFIKKHSKYYKTDGQLLANRKNYFDPQGKFLIYECQLSLGTKENHIGELGKGDTAGRAQRDAVCKLLKKLKKCAEILSISAIVNSGEKISISGSAVIVSTQSNLINENGNLEVNSQMFFAVTRIAGNFSDRQDDIEKLGRENFLCNQPRMV